MGSKKWRSNSPPTATIFKSLISHRERSLSAPSRVDRTDDDDRASRSLSATLGGAIPVPYGELVAQVRRPRRRPRRNKGDHRIIQAIATDERDRR